ncbi:MAG: ABC transporter permease [Nitrospinota bacterium]
MATGVSTSAVPAATTAHSVWRNFRNHRLALASSAVLAFLALLALVAPWISTYVTGFAPDAPDLLRLYAKPSWKNWFGTDELGRDVFTRIVYGGRVSLSFGITAAVASALIGVTVGSLAGYRGGWVDNFLMRLTDSLLSLPILPLMIILSAVELDKLLPLPPGDYLQVVRLVAIIVLFNWMTVARLVRASVLKAKSAEFVEASRAMGAGGSRILVLHILPNCVAPIIVAATLSVGNIILYESVLSFLGLGIVPPTPSWGSMLNNAQEYLRSAPWLAIFPGCFILLTVMSFNFLGDGLRDALDPHGRRA